MIANISPGNNRHWWRIDNAQNMKNSTHIHSSITIRRINGYWSQSKSDRNGQTGSRWSKSFQQQISSRTCVLIHGYSRIGNGIWRWIRSPFRMKIRKDFVRWPSHRLPEGKTRLKYKSGNQSDSNRHLDWFHSCLLCYLNHIARLDSDHTVNMLWTEEVYMTKRRVVITV
jgi:hypothetical protein